MKKLIKSKVMKNNLIMKANKIYLNRLNDFKKDILRQKYVEKVHQIVAKSIERNIDRNRSLDFTKGGLVSRKAYTEETIIPKDIINKLNIEQ